jgi:hypothetical protein
MSRIRLGAGYLLRGRAQCCTGVENSRRDTRCRERIFVSLRLASSPNVSLHSSSLIGTRSGPPMENCGRERAHAAVVRENDFDRRWLSGRELLKGGRHRCSCGITFVGSTPPRGGRASSSSSMIASLVCGCSRWYLRYLWSPVSLACKDGVADHARQHTPSTLLAFSTRTGSRQCMPHWCYY